MDVVQALRSDWTTDPFQFVEKDGYYYGRGTQDMKDSDAALVATFLRLHREGYKPRRDLILALTADEEGGKSNGAAWLVKNHRDLVDAAFVINPDAGGVELDHGRPVVADVEATEKIYSDFQVTATNRGGHSSLPRPDNAIYELTAALTKLAAYSFPFELNGVTRTYFTHLAGQETGQTAADIRAILATPPDLAAAARLSAEPSYQLQLPHHLRRHSPRRRPRQQRPAADRPGQRQLPHLSRPLPRGDSPTADCTLRRPQTNREVRLGCRRSRRHRARPQSHGPARRPSLEVFDPLTRLTQAIWPGIPVTPIMENGASDSIYFAQAGIPCYGYSAIALERDDDRAHGKDERLPMDSYWKSLDFFYSFSKALGGE